MPEPALEGKQLSLSSYYLLAKFWVLLITIMDFQSISVGSSEMTVIVSGPQKADWMNNKQVVTVWLVWFLKSRLVSTRVCGADEKIEESKSDFAIDEWVYPKKKECDGHLMHPRFGENTKSTVRDVKGVPTNTGRWTDRREWRTRNRENYVYP